MAKINVRVGAIALAPTIALIGFASLFTMGRWARYDAGAKLSDETTFAVAAGELVHGLQIERGLTTWHLRSHDTDSADLTTAREAVDRSLDRLISEFDSPVSAPGRSKSRAETSLLNAVDDIARVRRDVSKQAIASREAFDRYTAIVELGLSAISEISRKGARLSPDVGHAFQIYAALATGKEFAGRERAIGAAALTAPVTRASEAAEVARLEGAQSGAFAAIEQNLDADLRSRWTSLESSPEVLAVADLREELFAHVGGPPSISSAAWFSACTARINLLHSLEEFVARDVLARVARDMDTALRSLMIALVVSAASVIGAVTVALAVARSISKPLERLTEATVDLASGNLDASIEADAGHDEIAALKNALQVFRDGLLANQTLTRQLAEADRQTSLGALVAGIAHEVNTPIGNALMVSSSFSIGVNAFKAEIQSGAVKRSAIGRYLETAEEAARLLTLNLERASQQISSFKHLAVDQAKNDRRVLDLKRTIEDAVRSCTPTIRNAKVRTELDLEAGIELDSYPGAVSQVIVNLLENAVKHGLSSIGDGCIWISAYREGQAHACITVSDNGVGIPDVLRDKVFSAFFTTRAGSGGTGLGLHIVKSVVTGQLGGTLALDSNEGAGARFIVTVPLRAPADQHTPTVTSGEALVDAA